MKQPRHQARIVALQGLYQLDVQRVPADGDLAEVNRPLLDEAQLPPEAAVYAESLIAGTWANHDRYDRMIAGVADHWDVARMAVVDRNVLRLALHELLTEHDLPTRVVLDEAIELGREFGSAETPQFVNGVVDGIWKRDPACESARSAREAKESPARPAAGRDHGTV